MCTAITHNQGTLLCWSLCAQQCEDLEDAVSLAHVFRIVRGAIMLNDASLLEELLKVGVVQC